LGVWLNFGMLPPPRIDHYAVGVALVRDEVVGTESGGVGGGVGGAQGPPWSLPGLPERCAVVVARWGFFGFHVREKEKRRSRKREREVAWQGGCD